jgi:hypothetical protein
MLRMPLLAGVQTVDVWTEGARDNPLSTPGQTFNGSLRAVPRSEGRHNGLQDPVSILHGLPRR